MASKRGNRHLLLTAAVVLLFFVYVPHEIVRSGPNLSIVSLGFAVLLGIRYRVMRHHLAPIEIVALVFSAWIVLRLTVVASLNGEPSLPWYSSSRA